MENPISPEEPTPGSPPDPNRGLFLQGLQAYQHAANTDKNVEQLEAAALQMLNAAAAQAQRNPTPEQAIYLAVRECEARGDWPGAEAGYRAILTHREAAGLPLLVYKAQLDLANLYFLLEAWPRAQAAARLATAAARQADMSPALVVALETEALCSLRMGDPAGALASATAAVTAVEPGAEFGPLRAGALVMVARCHVAAGNWSAAAAVLDAARPEVVDQETSPFFAGQRSRTAAWWEATAALLGQQADWPGALAAWEKAVDLRRGVATLPHVAGPYTQGSLARTLRQQAAALADAGQQAESRLVREEVRAIWLELGLPGNDHP